MPIIARSAHDYPSPGEWAPIEVDGQLTALVSCPECGARGTLETHSISTTGQVEPSVRCTDGCAYHEIGVQLQGWKPN